MISTHEYTRAKYIIIEYERQQKAIERMIGEDVKFKDVLSTRAYNIINVHNKMCSDEKSYNVFGNEIQTYKSDDIINYASDAARFIIKYGEYDYFRKFRNSGKKTTDEIMKYVDPFLKTLTDN